MLTSMSATTPAFGFAPWGAAVVEADAHRGSTLISMGRAYIRSCAAMVARSLFIGRL